MTERAKRLGDYLETLGWNVWEMRTICPHCSRRHAEGHRYCPVCGTKTQPESDEITEGQLERALAIALDEISDPDASESFVD